MPCRPPLNRANSFTMSFNRLLFTCSLCGQMNTETDAKRSECATAIMKYFICQICYIRTAVISRLYLRICWQNCSLCSEVRCELGKPGGRRTSLSHSERTLGQLQLTENKTSAKSSVRLCGDWLPIHCIWESNLWVGNIYTVLLIHVSKRYHKTVHARCKFVQFACTVPTIFDSRTIVLNYVKYTMTDWIAVISCLYI